MFLKIIVKFFNINIYYEFLENSCILEIDLNCINKLDLNYFIN